jgi:uncharacterized SAM-binding protein YcdF (DUF218 family)
VAPIVAAFGLIGLLCWVTRLRRIFAVVAFLFIALWGAVAFTPLTRGMARPLLRADTLTKADAIYVLASNIQPDDEPSPNSMARGLRGLELLGSHLAPHLLVSELPDPAGSYVKWLQASAAALGGIDVKSIESVGTTSNTHDEAMRVAALFRERGWKKLLLVSSPTHMRRAAAAFERAGVPTVMAAPAIETEVDLGRLDLSDERIVAFRMLLHEWVGLVYYRFRSWA